jgi:hypothetical protein
MEKSFMQLCTSGFDQQNVVNWFCFIVNAGSVLRLSHSVEVSCVSYILQKAAAIFFETSVHLYQVIPETLII